MINSPNFEKDSPEMNALVMAKFQILDFPNLNIDKELTNLFDLSLIFFAEEVMFQFLPLPEDLGTHQ
ncbi:MAG: hypothetical protein CMH15_15695 [Mesonia sp.]|nr:hypothetical protein [Mesonia sp.]